MLDEADQIDDPDLLRRLYSIAGLTMILITNHERDLFRPLDERLQSRLRSSDSIEFDSYSRDELVARYSDRVDDPKSKRTVRTYLRKLEQYNLVQSSGHGPSRTYTAVE